MKEYLMLVLRTVWILLLVALLPLKLMASPAKDLEKAAQKGLVAFVIVTDGKTADISDAKTTIKSAIKQNKKSTMVELDRSNPDNADLVTKYKLATIPVPMIVVVNPSGSISGAIQPEKATPEMLAKMIPSPKKAEIIKALSEGNAVFITAYRKSMQSAETVNNTCAMACQQMAGKSAQVKIDMDDPAEAKFLAEMKINMSSTEPVTVVANPQGQIAGTYTGEMQVTELVTTAAKKVGGCCAPTVAKPDASCEPTKK
jgi:hypothetical protein